MRRHWTWICAKGQGKGAVYIICDSVLKNFLAVIRHAGVKICFILKNRQNGNHSGSLLKRRETKHCSWSEWLIV